MRGSVVGIKQSGGTPVLAHKLAAGLVLRALVTIRSAEIRMKSESFN